VSNLGAKPAVLRKIKKRAGSIPRSLLSFHQPLASFFFVFFVPFVDISLLPNVSESA